MPLMRQPKLVGRLCQAVADHIQARGGVHAVAGLEARGESEEEGVSSMTSSPFRVPVRSSDRTDPQRSLRAHQKGRQTAWRMCCCRLRKGIRRGEEVGRGEVTNQLIQDRIEVQKGAISPGDRVLIIDDLLATGGTLAVRVYHASGELYYEFYRLLST